MRSNRSDEGATLNSIPTEAFVAKLKPLPLSRILFVTIRDPTQKGRWCKIGKINDWIRKYSTSYFIVMGTNGGTHFHLLAGIEKNRTPTPVKGIHFHMTDLKTKTVLQSYPDPQDVDRAKFIEESNRNERIIRLEIPYQCVKISSMIKVYFLKKRNKQKSDERKTKKMADIERIIKYMKYNLDEPRDHEIELFVDYILKY